MRVLLIGDIVGKPGRQAVVRVLADFLKAREIDFVIANGENAARGSGRTERLFWEIVGAGVNVVTVWSFSLDNFRRDTAEVKALLDLFEDKTNEIAEHREVHSKRVRVRFIGELGLRG